MGTIQLENVVMKFKDTVALNDVTLEVKDKEFFVIFGAAGAGKTTLLNIIAGIYTPDQGKVRIQGNLMNHIEPEDRNVAMVFENYALYPHLTVFDNIASSMKSPRYRKAKEVIDTEVRRVAKSLNIDMLLERKPSELSNGQRQRVALGRALVRTPHVFLMDEPLTHLDAKLRHQMRAELKEMQNNLDSTTIYVTHDYLEALSLGNRIAVLNEGRIEQIGTPDEIYNYPATEFVAEVFGEPEINIEEAKVSNINGEVILEVFNNGTHLVPPNEVVKIIQRNSSESIRIGFRALDIEYGFKKEEGMTPATVYSFEPLGLKAILTTKINNSLIRLVAPGDLQVKVDEPIYLKFNMNKAIFFDKDRRFLGRCMEGGA